MQSGESCTVAAASLLTAPKLNGPPAFIVEAADTDMSSIFAPNLLKGYVALITGGGSGICFGIARSFGLAGAKVAIMGRRQHVLDDAVSKLKTLGIDALAVQGDVRSEESAWRAVDVTVRQFGGLDVLVNGAAGNFLSPANKLSLNAFKTVIDIDLNGTFNMCRAAYDALAASRVPGGACILNITATLHYTATQIHPSAAKAGIDACTRNLAVEWGPAGIRVNGIAPGPIADTEGYRRLAAITDGPAAAMGKRRMEDAVRAIPVGRLGRVEDCAQAAMYLVSSAGAFISGHTLVVDGGSCLYSPPFVSEEQLKAITSLLRAEKKAKAKAKL